MDKNRQLIRSGLAEFAERLERRQCWVTFEANGGEHWLQCASGVINMDWPFAQAPALEQLQKYFGSLAPFELESCDSDLYATVRIGATDTERIAAAIERIFRELYELGADYELSYKVEDA
jgi:hypothetical protein